MSERSQLTTKLAMVMGEVGVVQKGGFNEFHKYKYVEERHVLEAVRGKLAEAGIMLFPSVTALSEREVKSSKGKVSTLTTMHVRFTFVDSETGERLDLDWAGQGDDAGDKGINKAATSALKYFLLKTFLIPTGEPDPEGDKQTDETAADRVAETILPDHAQDLVNTARDLEIAPDRLQRAGTNYHGADVGSCDTPDEALEALGKLTPTEAGQLEEWFERVRDVKEKEMAGQTTLLGE